MIKVSWDEMSFMGMKLVYNISNTWQSWKQSHETPTETGLFLHTSKTEFHYQGNEITKDIAQ